MKYFTHIAAVILTVFCLLSGLVEGAEAGLKGVVNVNTASADQLMLLPGVGESKALAIIEARRAKVLAKKEDLLAIKGIGEKLVAKWAPYLAFSGETTLQKVDLSQ